MGIRGSADGAAGCHRQARAWGGGNRELLPGTPLESRRNAWGGKAAVTLFVVAALFDRSEQAREKLRFQACDAALVWPTATLRGWIRRRRVYCRGSGAYRT